MRSAFLSAVKLAGLPPRKKSPEPASPAPPSAGSTTPSKAAAGAPSQDASGPFRGIPGRIYLIDTMSFIFRAYHAMARQRPMSTKTGLPTAAIYVFVNMLR